MKHKFYLLLVLLISGLFIGCSSDDDGVTPPDDKEKSCPTIYTAVRKFILERKEWRLLLK